MKRMNMIPDCHTTDFRNSADVVLKEMVQIYHLLTHIGMSCVSAVRWW